MVDVVGGLNHEFEVLNDEVEILNHEGHEAHEGESKGMNGDIGQ
jgi:hypothetical protein